MKFGRQLLQKYSCERATATKDGTRCGGKRMHRYRDIDGTVIAHFKYVPRKGRLYCIVLLTFLSRFLENCASTSVLAFSARKFTVFLFVVNARCGCTVELISRVKFSFFATTTKNFNNENFPIYGILIMHTVVIRHGSIRNFAGCRNREENLQINNRSLPQISLQNREKLEGLQDKGRQSL